MFERNTTLKVSAEPVVTFSHEGEPEHVAVHAESTLEVTQTVPQIELHDEFAARIESNDRNPEHARDALTDAFNRTDRDWDWVHQQIEENGYYELKTRDGCTYRVDKNDFDVETVQTDPMYEDGVSGTIHFAFESEGVAMFWGFGDLQGGHEDYAPSNVLRLIPPAAEAVSNVPGIEEVVWESPVEGAFDMGEMADWK